MQERIVRQLAREAYYSGSGLDGLPLSRGKSYNTGMYRLLTVVVFMIALAALGLPLGDAFGAGAAKASFFNSKETRSTNLKPFKKWNQALARFSKEQAAQKQGNCKATKMNKCHYAMWIKYLTKLKAKKLSQGKIIQAINTRMNKAKYITDNNNWGKKDYWATPVEFMAKFGDCEDYAIIKYLSLRKLGFKDDQLRVVAVKDLNLKVGHAVLVVFIKGKAYLLDNQIKQVVKASSVRHYQPVFSINSGAWWRHRV